MASGTITTARGLALNIDELIAKAQRPIGLQEAKSTRASPSYNPGQSNTPRVRGFVPAAGSASAPAANTDDETYVPSIPKNDPIVSSFAETGVASSLADLTGIKVSKSSRTRTKTAATDEGEASDESLGDLLNQLEKPTK
jgi:hypothetical protein